MSNVEAVKKYQANRDSIMLRPSKDEGQAIRDAAAAAGKSVQGYVLEAIREKMEWERTGAVPADGSPAVSPGGTRAGKGTGTQGAGVMVFSPPVQNDNSGSRSPSLTPGKSEEG